MANLSAQTWIDQAPEKQRLFPARVATLFWVLAALQLLDFLSTWASLRTGQTAEQNPLILALAQNAGLSVLNAVFAVKIIAIVLFAIAFKQSKDSQFDRWAMGVAAVYYAAVCAVNFYWAATF